MTTGYDQTLLTSHSQMPQLGSVGSVITDEEEKDAILDLFLAQPSVVERGRASLDEKLQEVLNKLIEADNGRRQSEKELRMRETVAAMKRIFSGVKGRVHELCKPKQKKWASTWI